MFLQAPTYLGRKDITFPARSHFYCLKPIGIDTPQIESFTSYLTRLAEAHQVSTGILISNSLGPLLQKAHLSTGKNLSLTQFFRRAASLNGLTEQATTWVQNLETFTRRTDLRRLTALDFSYVFATHELLHRFRVWCPACYEEWRLQEQVVYEPLLWTWRVVTVCPRHQRRLQSNCPANGCRQPIPWLARNAKPGYCSHCGAWLGIPLEQEAPESEQLSERDLLWQSWAVKVVGELFESSAHVRQCFSRAQLRKSLTSCAEQITQGNTAELSRLLGLPGNNLAKWQLGTTLPVATDLVWLSYRLGISLQNLLTSEHVEVDHTWVTSVAEDQRRSIKTIAQRSYDAQALREMLTAILEGEETPRPSLEAVARRLGCSIPTLHKYAPDLCHAISAHYLRERQAERRQQMAEACAEVWQAVASLAAEGRYPAFYRAARLVAKRKWLRETEIVTAWEEALEAYGWVAHGKQPAMTLEGMYPKEQRREPQPTELSERERQR